MWARVLRESFSDWEVVERGCNGRSKGRGAGERWDQRWLIKLWNEWEGVLSGNANIYLFAYPFASSFSLTVAH